MHIRNIYIEKGIKILKMVKIPKLDLKDKRIIAALDMDARMPITELARHVQLSRQTVEYRIRRMQEHGVIYRAVGVFDSVVVGFKWYRVAFRLLDITQEKKDALLQYLSHHKHILWLGEGGGNWDLVMNFVCEDTFAFNKIFEDIISKYGAAILDYEVLIYVDVGDQERSYILPRQNIANRKEFFHEMKQNHHVVLDKLDKGIIKVLAKNAWVSNLELGKQLKCSANTVKKRIQNLRKKKILLGFRLFVHVTAMGYQCHMLFLGIKRLDLEQEKKLLSYLRTIPNITFIVKHVGRWRIGMEIETKTAEEFQKIFVDIRGKFNDIISDFESFPLFKDHAFNYFPEGCLE